NSKGFGEAEVPQAAEKPGNSAWMPKQEPGGEKSSALKYELYVDAGTGIAGELALPFRARNRSFGREALGSPFNVYAPGKYLDSQSNSFEPVRFWAFAVKAGDKVRYEWPLAHFEHKHYHLQVHGPNGFMREFEGNAEDPPLEIRTEYQLLDKQKGEGQLV